MSYRSSRALKLLRTGTGIADATFRPGQEEAVRHVVEGRGRLLVVERTGWGKSFVYFIATRLLREAGRGPALLVSPLLSLMRNQMAAATRMGVRAERITSDNRDDWPKVEAALDLDNVDILLIAPERFANEHFRNQVLAGIADSVSLLVIDECHCISDWGHDFRPDYQRIEREARNLPRNMRLLATTATANDRVMKDLRNVLGRNLTIQRGPLARPSLALQTILLPRQSQRLAWLAEQLPGLPGHGIIYTLTVRDAEQVADWLRSRGIDVMAYTGRMGTEEREELERDLLENRVKALVATVALGMGFDKPDLGFVVHYQTPGSAVAYYQQVGRAGRALEEAYGILLSGEEETDITDHFINTAFPTPEEAEQVIGALEKAPEGLSHYQLLRQVNLPSGRIERTTKLLSLESPAPIVKDGARWQLTPAKLKDSFWQRVERLAEVRMREQRQMQDYVRLEHGRMEFLIRALDGNLEGMEAPRLPPLPAEVRPQTERDALAFLRRLDLPIPPRSKWPAGGLSRDAVEGRIPEEHRAETGRALCLWGDGGWGEMVKHGKQEDGRFAAELVDAGASLVRRWGPNPRPEWVTCIPSRRNPRLVPEYAERLARALGLPFRPVLVKTEDRLPQKEMENAVHKARNVDGSLAVSAPRAPTTPVLLVDDIVGSRWTLTVGAWLLRKNGSGRVWPLALSTLGRG
ncbi:MAG: RecQ family ATP-dependent DNA helicase [Gammaproteobacteria bacterium]|nr:RecQ family ATP-dependent DNA helicase [Gammaproteobacteria bacterium]MDE0247184.1 RecQ family ATP-dependent DNA helicase [Gammaproteobacteria bacterium]